MLSKIKKTSFEVKQNILKFLTLIGDHHLRLLHARITLLLQSSCEKKTNVFRRNSQSSRWRKE